MYQHKQFKGNRIANLEEMREMLFGKYTEMDTVSNAVLIIDITKLDKLNDITLANYDYVVVQDRDTNYLCKVVKTKPEAEQLEFAFVNGI